MRTSGVRNGSIMLIVALPLVTGPVLVTSAVGADLANAKRIYVDKCLRCHGERGKGDGPKAEDLEKKPLDYTDKAKMAKLTDADLKKAIREGKSPMPAYDKKLTGKDIDDVIAYIRTFAGTRPGK